MTIINFLLHTRFSADADCPEGIDPVRWAAMFRWLQVRENLGEPFWF